MPSAATLPPQGQFEHPTVPTSASLLGDVDQLPPTMGGRSKSSFDRIVEKLAPDYPHYLRYVQQNLLSLPFFLLPLSCFVFNCLSSFFLLVLLLLPLFVSVLSPSSSPPSSPLLPSLSVHVFLCLFSSSSFLSSLLSSLLSSFLSSPQSFFPSSPPPTSISSGMISRVFFVRCVATTTIHCPGSPWTVLLTR